jgi:hypothetical protein
MTTSVRSLAEQQKFGRIFFHHYSFLFFPNNKNSAEFFCAFGSFIILNTRFVSLWFNPSRYPYPRRSRLSYLPANRLSSAQPVLVLSVFVPTHHASSSFLPFILPSRLVASTSCPRQYQSSFLALLGVPCILCSRWV